jgi:hypothetical protein
MMLGITSALANFRADAEALLRAPHRLSGTEEYAAAADHVEKRLREIGIETIVVQEFPSLQTEVRRCELTAGAGRFRWCRGVPTPSCRRCRRRKASPASWWISATGPTSSSTACRSATGSW